jgi:hypothetical protein
MNEIASIGTRIAIEVDRLLAEWAGAPDPKADAIRERLKALNVYVARRRNRGQGRQSLRARPNTLDVRFMWDLRSIVKARDVLAPDGARAFLRLLAESVEGGSVPDRAALEYLAQSIRRFQTTYRRSDPGPALAKAFGLTRQKRGRRKGSKKSDLTADQRREIADEVEQTLVVLRREHKEKCRYSRRREVRPRAPTVEDAVDTVAERWGIVDETVKAARKFRAKARRERRAVIAE